MSIENTTTAEISQHGFFLIIPAFIADDPDLDDATKMLFGRLGALSNKYGYCWATDEALGEMCGCKYRVISDRLKVLENKGYIHRDTQKEGMYWKRKIYPRFDIQKVFTKGTGVRDRSAPLCAIDTRHCAEEKDNCLNKTTTTETAPSAPAAVFEEKPEQQAPPPKKSPPPTIHKMYESLVQLDIPDQDKWQIQKAYTEDVVDKAVAYATHPTTQIKTTLVQMVKWACKSKMSLDDVKKESETPYEKVCKIFKHGEIYNHAECFLNSENIAFQRGMKNESIKLDKFFTWKNLVALCESFQIQIPKVT